MKRLIVFFLTFLVLETSCFARDFIVEFVQENYKETQDPYSNTPVIYHSIQVSSQAGPKMLILKGDDYHYRNWLRQFIARGKAFIVKVPDDKADLFITSSAFETEVTDVYPVNMEKYRQGEQKNKTDLDRLDPEAIYGSSGTMPDGAVPREKQGFGQKKGAVSRQMQKDSLDGQAQENKALEAQKELFKKQAQDQLKEQEAQKELAQKLAQDREKALEREKQEQAKLMARIADQKALEDQQRRQDFEQRWQQLKRRLLEDEKIKSLERGEREIELKRRWLELRSRLGIQ